MSTTDIATSRKLPRHESIDPGVRVVEMGSCTRLTWDAFMLFGASRIDEFKTLARKAKEKGLESGYMMLLGAARIDGEQAVFEDLAVDYAVQFGQSPPAWFDGHTRKRSNADTALTIEVESFAVDTIIEITVKMETPRPLVINVNKVQKVDASGVDLFNEALSGRIQRGAKTKLVNGDRLCSELLDRLKIVAGKPPKAMWDFCFSYFRLNGREDLFSRAGADYTRLGGALPPWKDLSDLKEEEVSQSASGDGYPPPSRLAALTADSASKFISTPEGQKVKGAGKLKIDCSQMGAGSLTEAMALMNFFKVFRDQGVEIHMMCVNEIFVAMFKALAIDQMVASVTLPGV